MRLLSRGQPRGAPRFTAQAFLHGMTIAIKTGKRAEEQTATIKLVMLLVLVCKSSNTLFHFPSQFDEASSTSHHEPSKIFAIDQIDAAQHEHSSGKHRFPPPVDEPYVCFRQLDDAGFHSESR